ncbi:DUF4062 domain-containing protein [Candidatus Woesearchaeota archaeon]|nr:DUF4062 domain-containing protein [Candidatus Woesearchaeota archaeon]
MTRVFLSHRYTGEDISELKGFLEKVCAALENAGHTVFCSVRMLDLFRENGWGPQRVYEYCLQKLAECDVFIPVVRSDEASLGMRMEHDKAVELGMRYLLLIREGTGFPEFRAAAQQVLEYDDEEVLCRKLEMCSQGL